MTEMVCKYRLFCHAICMPRYFMCFYDWSWFVEVASWKHWDLTNRFFCCIFACRLYKWNSNNNIMKRTMFFVVVMWCLIPASAQQIKKDANDRRPLEETLQMVGKLNRHENAYTEKLDSITLYFDNYGVEGKVVFDYDAHFNCSRLASYALYDEWEMVYAYEYAYDEQDRLTVMIDYYDRWKDEYFYNAQNLVDEILYSSYETSGIWVTCGKTRLSYDEDNHLIFSMGYQYTDNHWTESNKQIWEYESGLLQVNTSYYSSRSMEWVPFERTEYNYNSEDLCIEETSYYWSGTWKPVSKTTFNYDNQLLCIEKIEYEYSNSNGWYKRYKHSYDYDASGNLNTVILYSFKIETQDWIYGRKYEYVYDEDNNCVGYYDYCYRDETWKLEKSYHTTYGTPKIEQVSGLALVWDLFYCKYPAFNKVNQVVESNEYLSYHDFHYSSTIGVEEQSYNKLTLWPNPARDRVVIEGVEADKVWMYDTFGQMVKYVQGTNEISVVDLPNGVYLVRVMETSGMFYTNKIAIQ